MLESSIPIKAAFTIDKYKPKTKNIKNIIIPIIFTIIFLFFIRDSIISKGRAVNIDVRIDINIF